MFLREDHRRDADASVPGMGMNKSGKKTQTMSGSSDSNRSESQGGFREELSTKEGRSKGNDRRNTNRQGGRMRAISVLGNAKSKGHRKTHQVEPGGTGPKRMFMHLTRGDLRRESGGEVSRGRSSEEARRKAGGAKGRRTTERATKTGLCSIGMELSETRRERQQRQLPSPANAAQSGWSVASEAGADGKSVDTRKEEEIARHWVMQSALKTKTLNNYGFIIPWDFAEAGK